MKEDMDIPALKATLLVSTGSAELFLLVRVRTLDCRMPQAYAIVASSSYCYVVLPLYFVYPLTVASFEGTRGNPSEEEERSKYCAISGPLSTFVHGNCTSSVGRSSIFFFFLPVLGLLPTRHDTQKLLGEDTTQGRQLQHEVR